MHRPVCRPRRRHAPRALAAALSDPTVDYVLALGVRATAAAAAADFPLSKPVLGALVQESDLVTLPVGVDARSQKENFAVVALPSRAAEQLAALRAVVPFASLHVLIDEFLAPDRAAVGTLTRIEGALLAIIATFSSLVPHGVFLYFFLRTQAELTLRSGIHRFRTVQPSVPPTLLPLHLPLARFRRETSTTTTDAW